MNEQQGTEKKQNNTMAIIAYILFFVPLLTEDKNDPFVKFHVKQSITLLVASVLGSVIAGLIPILGLLLVPAISIASIVLLIMGILNAANGKTQPLPIIGKYAEQFLKF